MGDAVTDIGAIGVDADRSGLLQLLQNLGGDAAKGGIIFAIARKLGIPIRFIGVGEKAEDLRVFDADEFIEALFASDNAAATE